VLRELLTGLEGSGAELATSLAYLAGTDVELDRGEASAALRRSELLLATGGDPRRELDPADRAVTTLARDLDTPPGRAALQVGLDRLAAEAHGLPQVSRELAALRAEPDRAWRAFACALLAEALADES
jgi:hypothetical protein